MSRGFVAKIRTLVSIAGYPPTGTLILAAMAAVWLGCGGHAVTGDTGEAGTDAGGSVADASPSDMTTEAPTDAAGFGGGPSCEGLAAICGPTGTGDCCASSVVPGGTFQRDNGILGDYPATVSDFRLDTYEITVGRFRRFVAAYPASMPVAGSGKNPNDATDSGWDATWSGPAYLPPTQSELLTAVACGGYRIWSDAAAGNEGLPMNCLSWYEAYAFCIWDGGRLPTEAEWNYAAAGGAEQRHFPWSSPPENTTVDPSYAVYYFHGSSFSSPPTPPPPIVGSKSPKGDGRWGQGDLAGSVWEWTVDSYGAWAEEAGAWRYPATCSDCANLAPSAERVLRGGSFEQSIEPFLLTYYRVGYDANFRSEVFGARCARRAR